MYLGRFCFRLQKYCLDVTACKYFIVPRRKLFCKHRAYPVTLLISNLTKCVCADCLQENVRDNLAIVIQTVSIIFHRNLAQDDN